MTSTLTRNIAIAASTLGGILAGANLDRSIVQLGEHPIRVAGSCVCRSAMGVIADDPGV